MQSILDPVNQRCDSLCPTCHGAGWVDRSLVCYCGRAATFYAPVEEIWYCGSEKCEPKKHPIQNRVKSVQSAIDDDDDDRLMAYQGMYY
jgi:hypothetical protein